MAFNSSPREINNDDDDVAQYRAAFFSPSPSKEEEEEERPRCSGSLKPVSCLSERIELLDVDTRWRTRRVCTLQVLQTHISPPLAVLLLRKRPV